MEKQKKRRNLDNILFTFQDAEVIVRFVRKQFFSEEISMLEKTNTGNDIVDQNNELGRIRLKGPALSTS